VKARGAIVVNSPGVIAGLDVARLTFARRTPGSRSARWPGTAKWCSRVRRWHR
jgi:hypothetical protein